MLRFLSIRNLAVIDRLELEFEPGLNVLTGETGAGKSILVGAVGLLVGGAPRRNSCEPVRIRRQSRPFSRIGLAESWWSGGTSRRRAAAAAPS